MKRLSLLLVVFVAVAAGVALFAVPYVLKLDEQVTSWFEGRRWELPARIYARPLDLYVGQTIPPGSLKEELTQLHYRREKDPKKPGEYGITGGQVTIYSRAFHFPDALQEATLIKLTIHDGTITSLTAPDNKESLNLFRLEPVQFASIYPTHNEDRILIKLADAPKMLIDTLLLVEDRNFYSHVGIRPAAILRAALANLRAGRTVQGGSTLTQQLVKNIFLTSEQTLLRKVNEAIMALLLEYHYNKDEILQTYLNEVYLGQDGKRAIHGFALASRFYFDRDLGELEPDQLALLVGIVRGASYYNPRHQPERALSRRNHILSSLAAAQLIDPEQADALKQKPLGVVPDPPSGITPYPAFLELVRRQLARDYKDEDLRSEGLSIFTTLDPVIQHKAETGLVHELAALEKRRGSKKKPTLEGVMLIASVDQGEVVAVVGGRSPRQAGFNRALDMHRPIGSIVKPAVYLTALERPQQYNLLTTIPDTPLSVPIQGSTDWQPENYDHQAHGPLPLMQALIHSYNLATVHLGMDLGVDAVIKTLNNLGVQQQLSPYPSLLLGAIDLPPIEVLQMYQTIAAGGYQTPLRAILAVTDQQNVTLQRYPLDVRQTAEPGAVFCLTKALEAVTTSGTATALQRLLPPGSKVAGKTGTTNDLRDSWFAGFSGTHVAVAWVGRDDNQSTGLTGATGALGVWAAAMAEVTTSPLQPQPPENIAWYYADEATGSIYNQKCPAARPQLLPFIRGGVLPRVIACAQQPSKNNLEKTVQKGLNSLFDIFQ